MEFLRSCGSRAFHTMQRLFLFFQTQFLDTIQWEKPAQTSVYLLATNAVFWYIAFYFTHEEHQAILVGVMCLVVTLDVICRLRQLQIRKTYGDIKESCYVYRKKSMKEKVVWLLKFLLTLGPLTQVVFPLLGILLTISYYSAPQVLIIVLCYESYANLLEEDIEVACWLAYSFLIVAVSTPPWKSNQISENVAATVTDALYQLRDAFVCRVIHPLGRVLAVVGRTLRYYLLGEWIPPLCRRIRSAFVNLGHFLRQKLVNPILHFIAMILSAVRYVVCGYWIPPLISALKRAFWSIANWVYASICLPIFNMLTTLWRVITYVILLKWVPPLCRWIYRVAILPPVNAVLWLKDMLLYIILGGWVPGLLRFIRGLQSQGLEFLKQELRSLKKYLIEAKDRALLRIQQEWILPTKVFIKNLIHAIKEGIRSGLIQLKKGIKTKIIFPFLHYSYVGFTQSCFLFSNYVLLPLWEFTKTSLLMSKQYAVIQWVEPGIEWVQEKIPEKSPFLEDSDTELAEFLPPGTSRHNSGSSEEEEGDSGRNSRNNNTSLPSRHQSTEDSDEHEFHPGTSFPTVETDSSDEEFSLREMVQPKPKLRRRKKPQETTPDITPTIEWTEPLASTVAIRKDLRPERPTRELKPKKMSKKSREDSHDKDIQDLLPDAVPDIDDDFEILDS